MTLLRRLPLLLVCLALAGCATVDYGPEPPPAEIVREPRTPQAKPMPPPRSTPEYLPRPPPRVAVAIPLITNLTFRDVAAVQTLVDRANFSCGVIDGKQGPKTRAALRYWQEANKLPATSAIDEPTLRALGPLDQAFTTRVVTPEDISSLTRTPSTWIGKSQAARLDYQTVLERVAEESHAAEACIRELNPQASWPNPQPGTVLTVPNPQPALKPDAERITISLGQKFVRVFDKNDALVALFPCSIAKDREKRPVGELFVANCAENPNYYFDPALFTEDAEAATMTGKLVIPAGPNNPVGVAWISLSLSGYGMHGTPHPEDIGKTESHGCFRLANWNAEKLLHMIRIGMPVRVDP